MEIFARCRYCFAVLGLLLLMTPLVQAEITITTFLDANNNGVQDEGEDLVGGLTVSGVDEAGNSVFFLSDIPGRFTTLGEVTGRVRVQVTGYDETRLPGVAGPTSVFFVVDGDQVSVPVSAGPNIVSGTTRIMVPCYEGGPAEGKTDAPGFVSFPYDVNGIAQSKGGSEVDPQMDASLEQIGTTWGVAYQNSKNRAFTSALLKRHSGLGPQGLDGLYVIDYNSATPTVSGFSIGEAANVTGDPLDFGEVLRENVDGDVDETMPYALTSAPETATYDMDAFDKVGSYGFGDIDLTEDEQTLWMVNLRQRSLIAMDVSGDDLSMATANVQHYKIDDLNGLPNLNFRYRMCVNAGGMKNGSGAEPFTDANGVAWDKNKFSLGGVSGYQAFTVGNQLNGGTSEAMLYQTYLTGDLKYQIPIYSEETYEVTLHFAEPQNFSVGDRKFDILIEGQTVETDFDIVEAAGGNKKAITATFNVQGSGPTLDVELISKQGNEVTEALISGVEIVGESVMQSGVLRPWGLTFHNGKGYLGLVSDGSVSHSREHLFGYVLSFDPESISSGFTEELAFPLGYPRERASNAHLTNPQPLRSAEWQAWVTEWEETGIVPGEQQLSSSGALLCAYPQPILSDIDFTDDGGLVVGLMDRWAHQTGYRNYPSILGNQILIVSYAAGDLLRVFETNGQFALESNTNDQGPFRQDDGPSYSGEFFYDDHYVSGVAHHGESFTGGLGVLPTSGEVVNTVFNPILTNGVGNYDNGGVYTQGIHIYNTDNGAKERAYLFVDQYISGKANGLGDMEFAVQLVGGEMGNYVWCDGNGNGIQDPQEYGIDGIMLTLHDKENSNQQVDMVTTSNGGQFIFDDLLPNHCYEIRIDLQKLAAMQFSGEVPPPFQGMDTLLDSDGDPDMIPGFVTAMFCSGPVGTNDHSIDFAFLGPEANECTIVECEDPMSMETTYDLTDVAFCVEPTGLLDIMFFEDSVAADSMLMTRKITGTNVVLDNTVPDSMIWARVSIPGDDRCYAIAKVTLLKEMGNPNQLVYSAFICGDMFDAAQFMIDRGFSGMGTYMVGGMAVMDPTMIPISMFPTQIEFTENRGAGCDVTGLINVDAYALPAVNAGADTTVCGYECVDLTALGTSFMPMGTGATMAVWTTSGDGTFLDDTTYAGARLYCPGDIDVLSDSIMLFLTVADDPCDRMIQDTVVITIESPLPREIPSMNDTIDCLHPFATQQIPENDTFPGCRMVVNCSDTISGTLVDYDLILGDCTTGIVKQIKRTFRFKYDKEDYFCMDTISIRSLPDTLICPPERDSVYCHTGYLVDENGHPSPLETGFPMADSIPLWPQPPSICDVSVNYKDFVFEGECPMTIRREWYIKNSCLGTYDSCVQWIMIFDTIGPTIKYADTTVFVPASSHDCFAHVYVPPIMVYDTCSDVKLVKAMVEPNLATVVLEYNEETGYWESHETVKIPISEFYFDFNDGPQMDSTLIRYEAYDHCHNITSDTSYVVVTDQTKPVAVCDKGLNVTVTDTTVWVPATAFDEGTWDNCGISMILARRTDWYEACGVDLCDNPLDLIYATEHHDSLWYANLETDKHINPVEAHYAQFIAWLCADGNACSSLVLAGWAYDLMKYATLHCIDHPYEVDESYFRNILEENDIILTEGADGVVGPLNILMSLLPCLDEQDETDFELVAQLLDDYLKILTRSSSAGTWTDIGAQIGGGWSTEVPFCCEDACQEVTVELLAIDYWCNWSRCWTTVRVEDKTPPMVVSELLDVNITCSAYKTYYQGAVELALEGDFDSLQNVLGRYDKVQKDQYGNVPNRTTFTHYNFECYTDLITKDSLIYDEHLGYIWKTYETEVAYYDTLSYIRANGQVADNCGLICIEEKPWVNIDHCGNGYIKRVFKFVGQCSIEGTGHVADTIVRHQTIWIGNDCEISKAMFEVPTDTIINSCGIEYAADGSGNVAGAASPDLIGAGKYVFDNDCRLVGIGYYDKVFKIVGGDQGCYKIIRTWCFADWCGNGLTATPEFWLDPYYEGTYITCTQKIILIDTTPPLCTIDSLPEEILTAGCDYDLNTMVSVEDECGVLSYSWKVVDEKTGESVASGYGELNSETEDGFPVVAEGLIPGDYKLKVITTDECQNEGICDAEFSIMPNKKPSPVCISSLTVELNPMDTSGDGTIDVAMAVIAAEAFDASSLPVCGGDPDDLEFRIGLVGQVPELPDADATELMLDCSHVGEQFVYVYVIDENGNWDYCQVVIRVQNNMGGCDNVAGSIAPVSEVVTDDIMETISRYDEPEEDISAPPADTRPAGISAGAEFELLQNRPNPFRVETTIGFRVPEAGEARMTVFDLTGKRIKVIEGAVIKGYQEWQISNTDLNTRGILYYQLETNNHVAVRKMILME